MRIFLEADILKWLLNLRVFGSDLADKDFRMNANGKYEINDETFIRDMEFGVVFGKILKTLIELNVGLFSDAKDNLDLIKETKTQASKLYNWNIIGGQTLSLLTYAIDKDTKDLILAGDIQASVEVIEDVYSKCKLRGIKMHILKRDKREYPSFQKKREEPDLMNRTQQSQRSQGVRLPPLNNTNGSSWSRLKEIGAQVDTKGEIDLGDFDQFIEYSDTKSCLEFVILGICRNIHINAVQAAALLANGNKYLSQLIIRGKKHRFQPVINMMQEVYAHCDILLRHMDHEETHGSIKFILQAYKPALISKELAVAKWGCRVISRILYDLANSDTLPLAWEWFGNLYGGFFTIHQSFELFNDDILEGVSSILMQIGRFSMKEMFTVEFRKILQNPKHYCSFVTHLLKHMASSKLVKEAIQNDGIFEFLIETAFRADETENRGDNEFKMIAIDLLVALWLTFPIKFEKDPSLGNSVLNYMKRSTRSGPKPLKISVFSRFSELLNFFSENRNPYAPVTYKILIFSLIENYQDASLREFLSSNICYLLGRMPSVPVNVLVEPLTKQLMRVKPPQEVKSYDLEVMRSVAAHPRLDKRGALQFFDVVTKLFLDSFVYQGSFGSILVGVLRRNIEEPIFCEYVTKFFAVALTKIYESFQDGGALRLDQEKGVGRLYEENENMANEEIEHELREKHRRAQIVNVLKSIILLRQQRINDELEQKMLFTNREISKFMKRNYRGIEVLINTLTNEGDAKIRIEEYDKEMRIKEEQEKKDKVRNNYLEEQIREKEKERQQTANRYSELELQSVTSRDKARMTRGEGKTGQGRSGVDYDDEDSGSASGSLFFDDISDAEIQRLRERHGNLKIGVKKRVLEKERKKKSRLKKSGSEIKESGSIVSKSHRPPKAPKKGRVGSLARRAMEDIERIKRKKEDARLEEIDKIQKKKLRNEKMNQQLNKELNWRNRQGQGGLEILSDFSPAEHSRLRRKEKRILENFVLINPSEGKEENLEKEYINLLFVRHKKPLSYLFNKYANSIDKRTRRTFEVIGKRAQNISLAELNKLFSDYGISQLIDKAETAIILKQVNTKIFRNEDFRQANYDCFLKLMVNVAALVHSRPPLYKPHFSYALMLDSLFQILELTRKRRGEEHPNFSDQQETAKYVQNKDLIDLMNVKLEEDPSFKIPPNFKKVYTREVDLDFTLPIALKIPEKYRVCFEILNEVIDDQFQVQSIEPQAKFFYKTRVKPKTDALWKDDTIVGDNRSLRDRASKIGNGGKLNIQELQEKKKREKMLKGIVSFKIDDRKQFLRDFEDRKSAKDIIEEDEIDSFSQESLPGDSVKKIGANGQKKGPSKYGVKSNKQSSQYLKSQAKNRSGTTPNLKVNAYNNNGMSSRAGSRREANMSRGGGSRRENSMKSGSRKAGSITNKVIQEREKREEIKRLEADRQEKKRQKRKKELEKEIETMKKAKLQKEQELKLKIKNDQVSKLENERLKEQKRRQRNESIKRQLKDYQRQQKLEKEEQEKERLTYLNKLEDEKRKRAREFIKKQNKKYDQNFKKEKEEKELQIKRQREQAVLEAQKEEEKKKKLEKLFEEDRVKRKREQGFNDKITQFVNHELIKDFFKRHEKTLSYVFKHYSDILVDPKVLDTNLQDLNDILHYRSFFLFTNQIGIVPGLFTVNEMKLIYRSTTRHQDLEERVPIGLDYNKFQEVLVRISIKKQEIFNRLYKQKTDKGQDQEKGGRSSSKNKERSRLDDEVLDDFTIEKHAEDKYKDFDKVSYKTLEGLMVFMDLPEDKNKLIDKMNSLRKENSKILPSRTRKKQLEKRYGELDSPEISPRVDKRKRERTKSKDKGEDLQEDEETEEDLQNEEENEEISSIQGEKQESNDDEEGSQNEESQDNNDKPKRSKKKRETKKKKTKKAKKKKKEKDEQNMTGPDGNSETWEITT